MSELSEAADRLWRDLRADQRIRVMDAVFGPHAFVDRRFRADLTLVLQAARELEHIKRAENDFHE